MRICMEELNWNHIRAFAAAVDCASLSAAARRLHLSQPTLSRQIAALEEALGVALFERVGRRLVPTEAGLALDAYAREMSRSASAMQLAATGHSETIEGEVRVSASDAISFYLLPALAAQLRELYPGIRLRIVASNALSDLRLREADIAIRHVRPEQPELFCRFVRTASAGFFASQEWVAAHGNPHRPTQLRGAPLIGADSEGRYAAYLQDLGLQVDAESFPVASDNSLVAWQLARQGLGITAIMHEIAEQMDDLVEVLEELPSITFPIWLVTHREVKTSRRIRVVFDFLADALRTEH